MDSTMQAVLQFVEENDVKFIRLAFCDVMGTLKNIAIMPSDLPLSLSSGYSLRCFSIHSALAMTFPAMKRSLISYLFIMGL